MIREQLKSTLGHGGKIIRVGDLVSGSNARGYSVVGVVTEIQAFRDLATILVAGQRWRPEHIGVLSRGAR